MAAQTLVNRIVRGLLRTPLLCRLVGSRLITLYVVGRKSGRRYTVPVAYTRHEGDLLIGTPFGWGRNLRTGEAVAIRLKGRRRLADVRVLADERAVVDAYAVMAATTTTSPSSTTSASNKCFPANSPGPSRPSRPSRSRAVPTESSAPPPAAPPPRQQQPPAVRSGGGSSPSGARGVIRHGRGVLLRLHAATRGPEGDRQGGSSTTYERGRARPASASHGEPVLVLGTPTADHHAPSHRAAARTRPRRR